MGLTDVVFFGDVVPLGTVDEAYSKVAEADGVLVAGTSLMVFSGFRFILAAHRAGVPIAIVNQGSITRAEKEVRWGVGRGVRKKLRQREAGERARRMERVEECGHCSEA